MADLTSAAELTKLASFLAPGFIVLGVRTRFKGGPVPDISSGVILYAFASSVYYAAVAPFFNVEWGVSLPAWAWTSLQYFLVPLLIAFGWVTLDQQEWVYRVCRWAKLSIAHHIPTAWDFAFRQKRNPSYIIVRLSDGTTHYGTWTEGAFASSSLGERDIYLPEAWDVDEAGNWKPIEPTRAILICSKDVSSIEIIGSVANV